MHKLVVPALHRRKITGSEGMVGLEGKVVELLTPNGLISVKGEYWQARSVGERVEIAAINGLTAKVKRKH